MLVAAFGDCAIYLMINPTKASYSMAPTMMVCALAGFLTAKLFTGGARGIGSAVTALIGLLIGLSVNFRLPNLFLAAGYCLYLAWRVPDGAKQGDFPARASVRHRIPDRDRADAGRKCDQCGKSFRDHLWRR